MVLKVQKANKIPVGNFDKKFSVPYEGRVNFLKNRKRNIQVKFYVDDNELALINEHFKAAHFSSRGAYLRKMAIDGFVVNIDTTDIKQLIKEVNAIGKNINQAVALMNSSGYANYTDVSIIKSMVNDIWRLLKSKLSSTLSARQ